MITLKDKRAATRFQSETGNVIDFSPCLLWQSGVLDMERLMRGFQGEGDVAEVGVYRGHFALCIAKYFPDKTVHLFDTFVGFPASEFCEHDRTNAEAFHVLGDFNDTSVEKVQSLLNTHDCYNIVFHEGVFPATAESVRGKNFCFVSIDVDLYKPTRAAWAFFYPRVNKGGKIVLYDDYFGVACAGARKATDEFLADKPESLCFDLSEDDGFRGIVYMVKE